MNDLMRVGGRLNLASITFEAEYQIILPKNDHVTSLVIEHYHLLSGHSGRDSGEKFLIMNASSVVGRVLSKCVDCRRQGPVYEQKMADLPVRSSDS